MINNEVIYIDITEEIYNNHETFQQWITSKLNEMQNFSVANILMIKGDRHSVFFNLEKTRTGSVYFVKKNTMGANMPKERVDNNNVSVIINNIYVSCNKYRGIYI